MNWGTNLTLLGGVRVMGWIVLTTMFQRANKERFVNRLKTKLLPELQHGDAIAMDNLKRSSRSLRRSRLQSTWRSPPVSG